MKKKNQLLPDRRLGRPESSLSLHSHGGGTPPHSWPQGGWHHHASSSEYSRYYWDVAAAWNGWFLTIGERASTPSFHWRSSSQALFPPPPSPVVSVAWIMERGDDVIRVCRRLWICPSVATPTLRETLATPRRSGYGDTSSFGLLKAWNWSLRPTRLTLVFNVPPATPTCAWTVYEHYSFTLCEELPGRLQRLGTTPTPATAGPGRQAWRTSPWRQIHPFHHTVGYAPGTLGLGLAQILMDGLPMFQLTYVPAYLRSGLPIRHQLLNLPGISLSLSPLSSSITSSSGTSIFLFYVIEFSSFYKIIFLFLFF